MELKLSGSSEERHDLGVQAALANLQAGDSYRQTKSPGPGATRIQVQHAISHLLLGNMAVTKNNSRETSRLGLQVEASDVVKNVDLKSIGAENVRLGEFTRPCFAIDVAGHHREWCNAPQSVHNSRVAHIAGVNDVIGTAEGLDGFGSKQAVRIGDHADHGHSPGGTLCAFRGPLSRILPLPAFNRKLRPENLLCRHN